MNKDDVLVVHYERNVFKSFQKINFLKIIKKKRIDYRLLLCVFIFLYFLSFFKKMCIRGKAKSLLLMAVVSMKLCCGYWDKLYKTATRKLSFLYLFCLLFAVQLE